MKFKKVKKNTPATFDVAPAGGKKTKSPSNSRTISELSKSFFPRFTSVTVLSIYRKALKVFIVFIFMLAAIIVGLDLDANTRAKQSIDLEREKLTRELKFWEDFIAKHQDFRDAYLQASILKYKLGDTFKAKIYVEKSLSLDPNSEEGQKIEEFLNK